MSNPTISQVKVGSTTYDINDATVRTVLNIWDNNTTPRGTILWNSGPWYMNGSQDAQLAYPISSCPMGILLHWQGFSNNTLQTYNYNYHFIPKYHISVNNGGGVTVFVGGTTNVIPKYLYVYDTHIKGHADNTATTQVNGASGTLNRSNWVLVSISAI